jgi:phage head maturation protease
VSCVTFPAYEDTSLSARKEQYDQIRKRRIDAWRAAMKARMEHGA